MAETKKRETKLDYLHRHYKSVADESHYALPRKKPYPLPPNTISFYAEQEAAEKKETILTRKKGK